MVNMVNIVKISKTERSIKAKILAILSLLCIEENGTEETARKLLSKTLKDVGMCGIVDCTDSQCMEIIDLMGDAIILILDGRCGDAKINLQKVVEEMAINKVIRRRIILNECCGELAVLPFDVREKIVANI